MNRRDLQHGIYQVHEFIEKLDLLHTFSTPSPLEVDDEFRAIALNPSSRYWELYESGLRNSHYNVLLNDYSYYQFSVSDENHVRYAFYPNPYICGDVARVADVARWRDLLSAEMITYEELLSLLRDATPEIRIPLLRYENAPSQYRVFEHPCSHFHIGFHSENRWPLNRVLSARAFAMFVTKMYYSDYWRKFNSEVAPYFNELEEKLVQEKTNCQLVSQDLFIDLEARSFHVS